MELLKKELPDNPCFKCSQRCACCGCPDGKKYRQAVQPYRDRGIYELALKLKRQKKIQREIMVLKNESKNITDEIMTTYSEHATKLERLLCVDAKTDNTLISKDVLENTVDVIDRLMDRVEPYLDSNEVALNDDDMLKADAESARECLWELISLSSLSDQLNAEWIGYMKAYRLYDPKHPQETVAYEKDLKIAQKRARAEGYSDLVLCDVDTMHVE